MHNLIQWLEQSARQYGSREAVWAVDGSLSFAALRQQALRVAAAVIAVRGRQNEKAPLLLYLPKSARALAALLGVLYSGNLYVPLDTRAPLPRSKAIFEITNAPLILSDAAGCARLAEFGFPAERLLDLEAIPAAGPLDEGIVAAALQGSSESDPAYLLFTSGSTGVPKGVVIPHRRVINYIEWAAAEFALGSDTVIGNQAPFYFTVSALDIYLCLAVGARLCLIPEGHFAQHGKLIDFLNEQRINLIFWVASAYHHLAKAGILAERRPQYLRHAWFVGEPMPAASLRHWLQQLPQTQFANLYGATETDMTLFYRVPADFAGDSVPLGRPCQNTQALLLDAAGQAVAAGEIGEICLRGPALALGYYRDSGKTTAAFCQNPLHQDYPDRIYHSGDLACYGADGLLYFHGRRDHQFKHLGYRVEAGEIEAVAESFPALAEACVIYDRAKRQIVLFYAAAEPLDEGALRKHLTGILPLYMIPTRYLCCPIPHNANGKKDRPALQREYGIGDE